MWPGLTVASGGCSGHSDSKSFYLEKYIEALMQARFDIYLMRLEVFCLHLNPPCVMPELQPGATGPPAHLGSVLFLGGLSQEGDWESSHRTTPLLTVFGTSPSISQPACIPMTSWGVDSTSNSFYFSPRPLSPSLNLSPLPNPASPGKQGADGSQQPGGECARGERG